MYEHLLFRKKINPSSKVCTAGSPPWKFSSSISVASYYSHYMFVTSEDGTLQDWYGLGTATFEFAKKSPLRRFDPSSLHQKSRNRILTLYSSTFHSNIDLSLNASCHAARQYNFLRSHNFPRKTFFSLTFYL